MNTPIHPTEAAMAAASQEIAEHFKLIGSEGYVPCKMDVNATLAIITRHFQSLLAKVDAECDQLRADLVAKGEALEAITRRVPIMGSTGDYREGQIHALEACRDVAASALAARAAGKEEQK